ncbi:MAG: F0F1 ATP synthase subunit delta [Betaproteobacteria bacterium]|nr:F0F1 ATP synthase subunit delta [Betaproteobacteria bacterium]
MQNPATLARPYAKAILQLARRDDAFAQWSQMLGLVAAVAADPRVQRLAGDPRLSGRRVEAIFLAVVGEQLTAQAKQLLRVLAENKRLPLLPDIRSAFERLRAEEEGLLEVRITSAFPLEADAIEALSERMQTRFGRRVRPHVHVDASLIGGVKIEAGDHVIDASVLHALDALTTLIDCREE